MAGPQLADIFWGEIAACCFDCHLTTINDFENFGGGNCPVAPSWLQAWSMASDN